MDIDPLVEWRFKAIHERGNKIAGTNVPAIGEPV
jgi:hypothetical protein